jgi:hypothetical protein
MTDPVERKKYRLQQMARHWATGRKIAFGLPIAFFCGMVLLAAIFGKH